MKHKTSLLFLCIVLIFFGCSKEKPEVQPTKKLPTPDIDLKDLCNLWSISLKSCVLNIHDSVVLFCSGDDLIDSVHLYSLNNGKMVYIHGLKFSHEDGGKTVVVNEIPAGSIEKRLIFDENDKIKSIAINGNITVYENGLSLGFKKGNYAIDGNGNVLSVCSDLYPYLGDSPCPLWGPIEGFVDCTTAITYVTEPLNFNYHYYALLMHDDRYRWTDIIIPGIFLNIPAKTYLYEVWKCKGGDTQYKNISFADYDYSVVNGQIDRVKTSSVVNGPCSGLPGTEIKFYYKN